ncbi:epoxide hydrolase YcdJ [Myriangium duriaei CBS 260.36]|uniref:Epoxide hydrolase YcdJ n=1 Tax=Myriangium duriaei CBS 260.36 TaxID=1168546 RepID=A0A9P4IUP4_9PEZI|nr:epoxide hydrolase YcdJ [Myriangium duriaei CBS 260.36]
MSKTLFTLLALALQSWSIVVPFAPHNVSVDGVNLFYREAGRAVDPTILLLHGSPDSSFGFRNLIPYLADAGYHVLAPDFPGFGFSKVQASRNYIYDLDSFATTIECWLDGLKIDTFSMYVFDIGGPVGFNLALSNKYNITAIVDQNAAVYTDAFGPGIQPLIAYGEDPNNQSARDALVSFLSPESITYLYLTGAPDPVMVAPESYTVANTWLAQPDSKNIELSVFQSFAEKVSAYPSWQQWLRKHQTPLLAIWGAQDPAQVPAGALAFKKDLPNAQVVLVAAGHFALETALVQIGSTMVSFLTANSISSDPMVLGGT